MVGGMDGVEMGISIKLCCAALQVHTVRYGTTPLSIIPPPVPPTFQVVDHLAP